MKDDREEPKKRTERLSAEERRATILAAAVVEFASYGLHGTSTEAIAKRAEISQPYIFRLFGTKKDLFLATCLLVDQRILALFRAAAEANPANALEAMGEAYEQLLRQRDELLVLLHSFAACKDPEIQQVVREGFAEIIQYVRQASGAPADQLWQFMAFGMLGTITSAIDLPDFGDYLFRGNQQ